MRSGHDDTCGQPCQSGDIEHVEVGQHWRFDWEPMEGMVVATERGVGGVIRQVTLDLAGDGIQTVTLVPGLDPGTWTRLDQEAPKAAPEQWHYGSMRAHLATAHAMSNAPTLHESRAIHTAMHDLYPERLSHSHPDEDTP